MKGDPYARYARWEPLTPIARFLAGFLAASAVFAFLQLVGIIVGPPATSVTTQVGLLGSSFQDQLSPGIGGAVSGLASALGIVTGVAWLIWQHRGQRNLYARRVPGLEYTPGWAVGWWFVPFANLVMPYLCMRELFGSAGKPAGTAGSVGGGTPRRDPRLLGWWLCYLGSLIGVVGFVPLFGEMFRGIAQQAPAGDPSQVVVTISAAAIRTARIWAAIGDVVRIASAAMAVWVVWTISTREDALGASSAPPPPVASAGVGGGAPAFPSPPPPRPDL